MWDKVRKTVAVVRTCYEKKLYLRGQEKEEMFVQDQGDEKADGTCRQYLKKRKVDAERKVVGKWKNFRNNVGGM